MKNLKVLIFDLGNVIIPLEEFSYWWEQLFLPVFQQKEAVEKLLREGFFVDFERGDFDEEHFLNVLCTILKPGFSKDDIIRRWNLILKEIPPHRVEFLRTLKAKGYQLYLLSNTNSTHIDSVKAQMQELFGMNVLEDIFDYCYYSYEMNEVKPDVEIYKKVIEDQQINPTETLFIDDKIENLDGAKKLGVKIRHIAPEQDIKYVLKDL
ncbi:MAG TPA: HAD family phosphatase [Chitinophagales bacterium]|nr:HAD family phosphatase [Chitinophagales bacterium]